MVLMAYNEAKIKFTSELQLAIDTNLTPKQRAKKDK